MGGSSWMEGELEGRGAGVNGPVELDGRGREPCLFFSVPRFV